MKKETELNEIRITVPEGMEIDKENSTFECIKFKKKEEKPWRSEFKRGLKGYGMHTDGEVGMVEDKAHDLKHSWVFATEKQAKSAQAMAQISQIMANDERFGGVITDEEWKNPYNTEFVIKRRNNDIDFTTSFGYYGFLAFHTEEQRDMFLKENEDLVKDYLIID